MTEARRYRFALTACAVVFGLLCILPNILQWAIGPYDGITIMGGDQELYYASRMREVMDGHWMLGNVYFADKELPFLQPPLPEWIMGSIGILTGGDMVRAYLIVKFLFGMLLVITMTGAWSQLTQRPWWSLAGAMTVLCAWFLFASPSALLTAVQGKPLGSDFLRFARLTNPQVSSTLFFGSLWAILAWRRQRRVARWLLAACLTGAMFYAYPYAWSFAGAALGIVTLEAAVRRRWQEVRALLLLGVGIGIVALPWLLHQHAIGSHPAFAGLAERFGLVQTHAPIWGVWLTVLTVIGVVAGAVISPRQPDMARGLCFAGAVVMNQQLITGVTIVPHHYHWYFIAPLAILITLTLLGPPLSQRIRAWTGSGQSMLFVAVIVVAICWGVKYQWDSFAAQRSAWTRLQGAAPVLHAAAELLPADATVWADADVRELIPVYTPLNVWSALNGNIGCLCSVEELRDRYFLNLWMDGLQPEDALAQLSGPLRPILSGNIHAIHYRETAGDYAAIPDALIEAYSIAYGQFAADRARGLPLPLPLDALVLPADQLPPAALQPLLEAQPAFHDERYALWRMRDGLSA